MNAIETQENHNLKSQLSNRVQGAKPSATLAVAAKARALKLQGKPLIDLGIGEPDFDTPDSIKAAGIDAIQKGFTKYTATEGTLDLRKTIAFRFLEDTGLRYEPNQIIASNGCKQSIYNLIQAVLNPGDEVIIPAPYWTSYPDMVTLAGGVPKIVTAGIEQNFKITPKQLEGAITAKTRMLIFNSPSNPSGMAYSKSELIALGKILINHPEIIIASDDIYEKILWTEEPFCNIVMACPELYNQTVVLNGVSKTYAMTGWRIGYAAGPRAIIEGMNLIQGQSTSGPCSISQKAAEAALLGDQSAVGSMLKAYKTRHDYLIPALNDLTGFQCKPGDGAFYAFPKIEAAMKALPNISNDTEFADFLLNEALIAVVPGSGFGLPGYIRMSFATSMDKLQEAVSRLKRVFNK